MRLRLDSGSVRARLVVMSLITTFVALVAASVAMLSYDVESYRRTWIADVTTQADIVAVVSAAAISFNDHDAARQNLELLRVRPQIIAGAIYGTHGTLFANYARAGAGQAPSATGSTATGCWSTGRCSTMATWSAQSICVRNIGCANGCCPMPPSWPA